MHQIGPEMEALRQRKRGLVGASAVAFMAASGWSGVARAQDHSAMPGVSMPAIPAPAPAQDQSPPQHQHQTSSDSADPYAGHDMTGSRMAQMSGIDHGDMSGMTMPAAFGPYPMMREASGTAWQPDASPMQGVMRMTGDWTLMGQAMLNGVYDSQSGRRGNDKAFVSGMVMGIAATASTPLCWRRR